MNTPKTFLEALDGSQNEREAKILDLVSKLTSALRDINDQNEAKKIVDSGFKGMGYGIYAQQAERLKSPMAADKRKEILKDADKFLCKIWGYPESQDY